MVPGDVFELETGDPCISKMQYTFREFSFPHLLSAIVLPLQRGKWVKHGQASSLHSLHNDLYISQISQFLINPSKNNILFVLN